MLAKNDNAVIGWTASPALDPRLRGDDGGFFKHHRHSREGGNPEFQAVHGRSAQVFITARAERFGIAPSDTTNTPRHPHRTAVDVAALNHPFT